MTTDAAPTIKVCFQFVTKGSAVIDSEAEEWSSIKEATERAEEWMNLPAGKTIAFATYEGDGAVVRVEELEYIHVMPAEKMAKVYAEAEAFKEEFPK